MIGREFDAVIPVLCVTAAGLVILMAEAFRNKDEQIPLAPMAPKGIPSVWRANFYRIDRDDPDEFSAWSPTFADPPDFHVPNRFGYLRM